MGPRESARRERLRVMEGDMLDEGLQWGRARVRGESPSREEVGDE